MFLGKFPEHDWQGRALTSASDLLLANTYLCSGEEPYFCVLWSISGDIEWYNHGLKMQHHASNQPCDYCPASKDLDTSMWPTNFGPTAAWPNQLRSAEEWRAYRGEGLHILFRMFMFFECPECRGRRAACHAPRCDTIPPGMRSVAPRL